MPAGVWSGRLPLARAFPRRLLDGSEPWWAVVDRAGRALRSVVHLLGGKQNGRVRGRPSGRADGQRDGRRGLVVGQVQEHDRVVVAEREVERLELPAQALGGL